MQGFWTLYLIVFYHSNTLETWAGDRREGLCFVPTMGALHAGHLLLVKKAKATGMPVLVSIFVNPAQFNNPEDLAKYPRTTEADLMLLHNAGADAVFLPQAEELYPTWLNGVDLGLGGLERVFEASFRPGHFEGVVKVLHRLFSLIQPTDVFFGQKDLQQCLVVEKLIAAHFPKIKQHNIHTARDRMSGLALSSRNRRLSEEGLKRAGAINWALQLALQGTTVAAGLAEALQYLEKNGIEVEYLDVVSLPDMLPTTEIKDGKTAAVFAGYLEGVRLIDNRIYEDIPELPLF